MPAKRQSAKRFGMKMFQKVISRAEEEIFMDGMEKLGRPMHSAAEVAERALGDITKRIKMEFLEELIQDASGKPMIAGSFLRRRLEELEND